MLDLLISDQFRGLVFPVKVLSTIKVKKLKDSFFTLTSHECPLLAESRHVRIRPKADIRMKIKKGLLKRGKAGFSTLVHIHLNKL
jgi:hypothetical protein